MPNQTSNCFDLIPDYCHMLYKFGCKRKQSYLLFLFAYLVDQEDYLKFIDICRITEKNNIHYILKLPHSMNTIGISRVSNKCAAC